MLLISSHLRQIGQFGHVLESSIRFCSRIYFLQNLAPVCGFFVMEQFCLCAVWPMENWLGSSLNHIQGWTTVRDSYSRALQQGSLLPKEKGVGEISGAGTFSGLPPVGVKSLRENSFCSCQVARPSRALAPSSLSLPFVLVLSSRHL